MLKVQGLMAVEITLNGETRRLDQPTSVRGLLESLGLDPAKIAVERNLEIVPRSTYDQVALTQGDRLEIVHFIGGGNAPVDVPRVDKPFVLAGKTYTSRLIIGTGKYKTYADNAAALEASGGIGQISHFLGIDEIHQLGLAGIGEVYPAHRHGHDFCP